MSRGDSIEFRELQMSNRDIKSLPPTKTDRPREV